MKTQIQETLEKDITEMLDFLSQSSHWTNNNRDFFEYEFMVDKDGQLLYEQWSHSKDEEPVDMDASPLFRGLKDLHYTGVCYVRFHNHGTFISGDLLIPEDDYILEVVLTNAAFHNPASYYLSEEEGEVGVVFLTEDHPEDDRYFFPLSKGWKIKQEEHGE